MTKQATRARCDELGDYSEKVTPVPIPNTVVKLLCADGTAALAVGDDGVAGVFEIILFANLMQFVSGINIPR